ncbi:MAG: hypothetical protein ACHP6H_00850, partial [Legionellales bacterium]
ALYVISRLIKKQPTTNGVFILACLLGFLVQSYQQTCLMNWSMLFEQWLHNQQFTQKQLVLQGLMYQILYITPLIVTLILYVFVGKTRSFVRFKEGLNTLGYLILMIIGLMLIIYPTGLSYLGLSFFITIGLIIYTWFLRRRLTKQGN